MVSAPQWWGLDKTMKLRIGSIEISDVSPDELDSLIKRYGSGTTQTDQTEPNTKQPPQEPGGHAAPDAVILRKLVDASEGVPVNDIGALLGRRGKAARRAIQEWAQRVRLVQDTNLEVCDYPRVGTRRNARLKPEFRDLAREILQRGSVGG
jgi:hypothetical protein